jgi:hypothetical protein
MHENVLKRATRFPLNLQVTPNPDTKVTMKEKVLPIFSSPARAEHTMKYISDIPMSPSQHVSGINPVTNKQPSKKP